MKWRGTWCLVVSGSLHIWTCLPTLVQYNMLYDFLTWDSVWVLNLFLFFSLCFYRRNFAKSLIFPGWLRSSNDLKQICRYPSCKVFPARWLLHITFLFYGYSNFVYTWCFNRTVLESTKLFTGFRHLLKFLLVMKEIIKDSYETAFQLLWRWFIFFPLFLSLFFVLFCFFVPYPNNGMKSRFVYFIHVSLPWIQLHRFFSKVNSKNIINIIVFDLVNIQIQAPLSYMVPW